MLRDVRNAAVFPFLAGVLVLLTCDPDQLGVNLTGFLIPPSHQAPSATAPASQTPGTSQSGVPVRPTLTPPTRSTLSVVVLDPAHGGTDPGARGGAGLPILLRGSWQNSSRARRTLLRLRRFANCGPSQRLRLP